ncbi:MAG: hypothetical protein E7342_02280 [Clostridiales bacterium]|nr:hypothetical protein [Clostridiales bacterium]
MKKRLTILFVALMVISTTLFAFSMNTLGVMGATNGVLTFERFAEGGVTGTTAYSYDDDTYFTSIGVMGSKVTAEIVKDDATNEVFYRSTSTGDSGVGGGLYVGLKGFVAGDYTITITLRFSEGVDLRPELTNKVRFNTDNSTDKGLDSLYEKATADANGWKVVTFEKTTTKTYAWLRLYNQFVTGGVIDVKEVTITPILIEGAPDSEAEADLLFNLADYTIVYGEYEAESLMKKNATIANLTDWDFNRLIAEEFKANLKSAFNVDLPIVKDTESNPTDKEILIGNTNRKDYQGYLKLDFVKDAKIVDGINTNYAFSATDPFKYAYGLQGNDIYIVGGCYGTTYAASNFFLNYLKSNLVDGKVNIEKAWKETGTHDLEVIGCIGDSITQGYKSTSYDTGAATTYCYFAYPSYLQRLNWKSAYVYNFGRSARTMLTTLANSYQKVARWTEAQKVKDVLDKVIIALGTNDSKLVLDNAGRAWTNADSEQFVKDFFTLVDTLSETNKNIEYIFSNCPKNYSSSNHAKDFILDLQAECVKQAKDKGYTIELFDMNTYSKENMPMSTYYDGDKLHPNSKGYHKMATALSEVLDIKEPNFDLPNTPDTPDTPVDDDKGGCGSVIGATSAILSSLLLAGAVVMLKKKD